MATNNTFTSTPLDDLKDLVWEVRQACELLGDYMSYNNIDVEDYPELSFVDDLPKAAITTLAKHVPGMSGTHYGTPQYDSEAAAVAANTYADGTPVVEHIEFPDVTGLAFTYRHRHNGPRAEFLEQARKDATAWQERQHARTAIADGSRPGENVIIEHIGGDDAPFSVVTVAGDDPGHITLDRDQLLHLREGIDRVLATEQAETERDAVQQHLAELMREAGAEMQARVPEVLAAITAGTATAEQLGCVVVLPGGLLKTWENVTPDELEALRRAHSF